MYDIFAQKLGKPRRTSTDGVHKEDNTKHGSKSLLGPEQVLRDKFIKSVVEVLQKSVTYLSPIIILPSHQQLSPDLSGWKTT
jgi:hypothetical protein